MWLNYQNRTLKSDSDKQSNLVKESVQYFGADLTWKTRGQASICFHHQKLGGGSCWSPDWTHSYLCHGQKPESAQPLQSHTNWVTTEAPYSHYTVYQTATTAWKQAVNTHPESTCSYRRASSDRWKVPPGWLRTWRLRRRGRGCGTLPECPGVCS